MIRLYLLLTIVFFSGIAAAQHSTLSEHSLPVPNVPGLLFYIQRDPDINTVVYTLNTDQNGKVDQEEPVKIFWIKYTEGGIHKALNLLQKDLGYGISIKPAGHDLYDLKAVAYPKMKMQLLKGRDNVYHVRLILDNRECKLKRIFIRITGGSHLHPNVAYLEFHGTDISNGKPVMEKLFPD